MDIRNMIDHVPPTPLSHLPGPPDLTRSPPQSNILPALNAAYQTPPQQTPPPQNQQQPYHTQQRIDPLHQAHIQEPSHPPPPYYSPDQNARVREKQHRRSIEKSSKACKTCLYCRKRKTKCNSIRPSCEACSKLGRTCIYPEDSRRLQRPSVKEYQEIKQVYQQMAKKVAEIDGTRTRELSPRPSSSSSRRDHLPDTNPSNFASNFSSPYYAGGADLNRSTSGGVAGFRPATPYDSWVGNDGRHGSVDDEARRSSSCPPDELIGPDTRRDTAMELSDVQEFNQSHKHRSLTTEPVVARRPSSHVNTPPQRWAPLPEPTKQPSPPVDSELQNTAHTAETTKERLAANAAFMRQKEDAYFRSDYIRRVDFDGVDPDLALHLLDLHWDGPHYNNLLTYRPVIVDCLIRNGPVKYCNKLLLNAIFCSSAVLSDRPATRADPRLPGYQYYSRFRRLLVDEIDKPSIPTATGLLLVGSTLSAAGMTSAGWMLCGIGYRMIGELRCDTAVEGRLRQPTSEAHMLALDVDTELRKRLFYAAYLIDAHHSLYYGRTPAMQIPDEHICQTYKDDYEETENYLPYDDSAKGDNFGLYEPRPGFAVSTAEAMLQLGRVATRLSRRLYNVDTLSHTSEEVVNMMKASRDDLAGWHDSVPKHILFDPEHDATPAPHHMVPVLLYNALQILVKRPFVSSGAFDVHVRPSVEAGDLDQEAASTVCINAAKAIKDVVEAYKAAFTLRNAPFIVMYCCYAAAVGILSTKAKFKSRQVLAFIWTALQDCREGSNRSLVKPASIIRDVAAYCKANSHDGGGGGRKSLVETRTESSVSESTPASNEGQSVSEGEAANQDKMEYVGGNASNNTTGPSAPASVAQSPTTAAAYGPCDANYWPLHDPLYGLLTPGRG